MQIEMPNIARLAVRVVAGCAAIVAAGFLQFSLPTSAIAQTDNVESENEAATADAGTSITENAHSEVPKPLLNNPSIPRNKIDGTSYSLSKLKPKTRPATPGWLRTYATVALPPDLLLAVPDYYETVLESEMRATIQQSLAERDIETIEDPDQTPFRLTYAVEVREPEKSGPRQSRLRLESDSIDNQDSWSPRLATPGNGVRPGISLSPMPDYDPRGPVLRATIIVLDQGERIWSGFAEAELGDHRRSELTTILVRALMRHWGQNAELDNGHFSQSPGAGLYFNEAPADQP